MSDVINLSKQECRLRKIPIMCSQGQVDLLLGAQILCEAISYNEVVRRASIVLDRYINGINTPPSLFKTRQKTNIRVNLNLDDSTIERLDKYTYLYGTRSDVIRVAIKLFHDQYTLGIYHI